MSRRRLSWLVAIPLMVAGSLTAHELSYWLVVPDGAARDALLAGSGHGYLRHAPLAVAILAAVAFLALAERVVAAVRRESRPGISSWVFFLLPLLGFVLQEHLERFLHSGQLPLAAALEPTFLIGLALQLPFALAALAIARLLLGLAERLGVALSSLKATRSRLTPQTVLSGSDTSPVRRTVLALGYPVRGPPLPAL